MMYCVYYKNGKRISEIIKCDPDAINSMVQPSWITVQMSEDVEMLRNNPFFNAPQKQKEEEQKILDQNAIDLLKEYQREKRWLKLQQTVKELTGQNLCCQTAIDAFMASI